MEFKAKEMLQKIRAEISQRIETLLHDNLVVKGHIG
jgi:hypothetical protein